jgi:NAD(P)-dependent dehydrogenase (short-subunit alcohol dehydrogenase family)
MGPQQRMETDLMLLKEKVALITGGAGLNGLGYATARQMAAHGAHVVILDLERADPAGAAAGLGDGHMGVVADVTDRASCEKAVSAVLQKYGRIDILFNNAGAQKSGSIINTSSVSAQRGGGILGGPHYSAAKAGMLGLGRAMAREFGIDGIRVNAVTPGLIATDINKGLIPEDRMKGILEQIPLNRIGVPDDVAGCVVFLASDLSKYLTGVTLDVNGGMLIH